MRELARSLYHAVAAALPERASLRFQYLCKTGRLLDLDRPRTYNERLQAYKLSGDAARMAALADKLGVKAIVRERLGEAWVTPTLWAGAALPPRGRRDWPLPYVLKATHGSGWNIFVRRAEDQDWRRIETTCRAWLARTYMPVYRERHYALIPRGLLVEPYLGAGDVLPTDYKVFVFGGAPRYIQVDTDRATAHKRAFFDPEWRRQPFAMAYPPETREIARPAALGGMLWAAARLAEGFPFARVDFYEIDGRPRFGEVTFFDGSGFVRFDPPEYDRVLGGLWPSIMHSAR